MELYYSKNINTPYLLLEEEEFVHCTRSMRHKAGDMIFITDGKGHLWECCVREIKKQHAVTEIVREIEIKASVTGKNIGISPTKNPSRMEWFVEKAVEIGIDKIILFYAERSERKKINIPRLERIMISAVKQSLHYRIPELIVAEDFKKILEHSHSFEKKYIAHCLHGQKYALEPVSDVTQPSLVLIGPEGDFSSVEIEAAKEKGFIEVSLGKARLRTETAGLVALVLLGMEMD